MTPQLQRVGATQSPVVIIDGFSGAAEEIARIADALAPFPSASGTYYPGVRRLIRAADEQAYGYVTATCERAASFIGGAFDRPGFDLLEASFSIVATDPAQLAVAQRVPHFDSTDPGYLAILHYLRVPEGTGTAFYRQRTTGIEVVTERNRAIFIATAEAEARQLLPEAGYIIDSSTSFEKIGAVEAVPDRLIIYHGSLLHSGIIPAGMKLSADPREGRLTANLFVRGH